MDCPFYTALKPNTLQGRGLFANQYFPVGTVLLKVADNKGNVTAMARWINSASQSALIQPNIILHKEPDGYYAVAAIPIFQGREIIGGCAFSPNCMEPVPFGTSGR